MHFFFLGLDLDSPNQAKGQEPHALQEDTINLDCGPVDIKQYHMKSMISSCEQTDISSVKIPASTVTYISNNTLGQFNLPIVCGMI